MKLNKEGQSTLEFIFSFAIVFSFIFFFFKIALNYTNGYLLHYANFMASRTYLVHDINSNIVSGGDGPALKEAKAIFATYNIDSAFVFINGIARCDMLRTIPIVGLNLKRY